MPALEALASRAPFPVELDASVEGRASAGVEAAAYFVVSEALADSAKHAGAERAAVSVSSLNGDLLSRSRTTAAAVPTPKARACRAWPIGSPRSTGSSASRTTIPGPARSHPPRRTSRAMRLVIADDSVRCARAWARRLEDAGFEVVGQAGDAEDLLRKVGAHKPDAAIVDVRMPPDDTD